MDYFLAHREDYRLPERVTFCHACFGAARGDRGAQDAQAALADLQDGSAVDAAGIGDPPVAASPVIAATRREVGDRFGPEFADTVLALEPGPWAGPVASACGQHVVLVTDHAAPRLPELAEVAGRVAADLDAARRAGAIDAMYARLRASYEVVTDDGPGRDVPGEPAAGTAAFDVRA
jgi:hypothetical protein